MKYKFCCLENLLENKFCLNCSANLMYTKFNPIINKFFNNHDFGYEYGDPL